MELRDYVRILRRSWAVLLLATLLGVSAGAGYSLLDPPRYSASSKVFVSTSSGQSAQELAQGNSFTVQRVKTYSDLAKTPIVLLPVIAKLQLNMSADALASDIAVSAAVDTTIIEITASNASPVMAADIANTVSESLTAAVEEIETTDAGNAMSPVKLTMVQQADVPSTPVSPRVPLNLALGAFVGLALGLGAAVLREMLDNKVRNERDLQALTPAPVIGAIAFDPKAKQRPLIVHANPRSPRAESFRTLRTNLSFIDVGTKGRTFVITSSVQSEGKSTTGANLAITLADAGARVLLVDADLRRPKVAEYMGVEGGAGLTDVLIGRAELPDVVQPWGKSKLFVLPAGKIPPNPSELLGSRAMAELILILEREFDAVIFDAPPLLPVTDAAILSKSVGGAIVVVASGRTHKNQLKGALTALENVGASVSGIVLTMMPTSGPDAYGNGRYGYGYGYGASEADVLSDELAHKPA
ncbi:polysaccharide biosynthesis tyrosine autokinase [Mycetocola zhadangensis]|uniref:non-specific protein-tyrosine kinase n=1 Tax=Mycetocola zhadangensis TaxID=1164595 RepID=A0A3L7IX11_9MICO|nr:polysaccharide biosynthesis tyrosine autokinase [Mycetocola zhadangensis]RLQ82675.1 polysaccharide biosynthesis tyrosine autokinase [Mycetocola zhadangensis]GGE99208.1 chromosome partitioning protein [Mycetocola zhadangensis]